MHKKLLGLILLIALAVSTTACSGRSQGSGVVDYRYEKFIRANSSEPKGLLLPAAANDDSGGKLVDLLYAGLVAYDTSGEAHYEEAEEISLEGDRTYRIRLRPDLEFSDGTPVTAQDYVDSWNFAVAQELDLEYFMEPIAGYEPGVSEMSGLQVVDERTFTVELTHPQADFEQRLGYSAFAVIPPAARKDMISFNKRPYGSGPYVLAEWYRNDSILLVPNERYTGVRPAQNKGIRFQHYENLSSAYFDLQHGNLDLLEVIPPTEYSTFEEVLGGRIVNDPAAIFQALSIPMDAPGFVGEAGRLRRQAISLAIDRQEVIDSVFQGSRTMAKDFTSPAVEGYSEDIPGNEVLRYDPVRAQELWEEAEEIEPFDRDFTIAYNTDGNNEDWVVTVARQLQDVLHIAAYGDPYPTFADYRNALEAGQIVSGFRSGWIADYPAISNFLEPMYASNGSANDTRYYNPEFDRLLGEAAQESDIDRANRIYQEAEELLFQDLPSIPLWYNNTLLGYSKEVENVQVLWNGLVDYPSLVEAL